MPFVDGLRCRECGRSYPAEALHVCEFCFGPLEVAYDHESTARAIEAEGLPSEFAETLRTGWWTTCLENLPSRERARGRF